MSSRGLRVLAVAARAHAGAMPRTADEAEAGLTLLGLLQYLTPTLQLLCGVVVLGEDMPPERRVGFVLVWIALVIFTLEATNHHRRQLRLTALATSAA